MPQTCTICRHKERDAIDLALLEGQPLRDIARQFNVSRAALDRHKDHLPGQLVKAHEAAEIASAGTLLDRLRQLNDETRAILAETREIKNHDLSLKALARLEKQLELEAKLLGELKENETTVHIYASPEWVALRSLVITALRPYPEAAQAVGKALSEASQ